MNPESDANGEEELEKVGDVVDPIIQKAMDALMEHCSSVRIFVTRHSTEGDMTLRRSMGSGNFYAQYGQITAWMKNQDMYFAQGDDNKEDETP